VSYLTWTGDGLLRRAAFMELHPEPAEQVRR